MPPLRIGSVGDDVVSLQLALVAVGLLSGEPTGAFDQVTQRAVIELQRRAGLPQSGVMDDSTWNALFQMQASVAPTTGGEVTYGPRQPGTWEGDTTEITGTPGKGTALFFGLLAGAVYWWAHKDRAGATDEYEDDGEEDEDEEEDDEGDFEPDSEFSSSGRGLRDYDDAVTDSLIEEPARISHGGRSGDCKKAAMRLMRVQALVQRANERDLYDRTVKKVASNCRGEEKAIEAAIEDEAARQEELTDDLLDVIGQTPVRDRAKDSDREANIEARKKAQQERLQTQRFKKRSASEDGPTIDTEPHRGQSRKRLYESGFRKVKTKLTRRTTTEPEKERSGRGKGQGNRRGSSAIKVRRGGKQLFTMRKEKAKTKRGYTWRKE